MAGRQVRSRPAFGIPEPQVSEESGLDADTFRQGFADATAFVNGLPTPWARHHATSTLAERPNPSGDRSYTRGYRAALHGFLRKTAP